MAVNPTLFALEQARGLNPHTGVLVQPLQGLVQSTTNSVTLDVLRQGYFGAATVEFFPDADASTVPTGTTFNGGDPVAIAANATSSASIDVVCPAGADTYNVVFKLNTDFGSVYGLMSINVASS